VKNKVNKTQTTAWTASPQCLGQW